MWPTATKVFPLIGQGLRLPLPSAVQAGEDRLYEDSPGMSPADSSHLNETQTSSLNPEDTHQFLVTKQTEVQDSNKPEIFYTLQLDEGGDWGEEE